MAVVSRGVLPDGDRDLNTSGRRGHSDGQRKHDVERGALVVDVLQVYMQGARREGLGTQGGRRGPAMNSIWRSEDGWW